MLGFHAGIPWLAGGYVGVDVFFVISGFLITGLLLAQVTNGGVPSLSEFYARRARRILPSAGVVLIATALASWLLLPPLRQRDIALDLVVAALQAGNWRFVANQTNYLAAHADPSPLLHYWSLGVEEQFYLVWAPMIVVLALLARRIRATTIPVIACCLIAVTGASFALSLNWTHSSGPLAYLGSPSRAWQFGIGGLATLVVPCVRRAPDWLRAVAGVAGLAVIGWSTVAYDGHTPFPGTAALVPTLGAAAIVVAGPVGPASRLLSLRPMRFVGRLSYCWYLWHWPVLVLAEARFPGLSVPWKVVAAAASGIPAVLTMMLVERPLRRSAAASLSPGRGLSLGASAIVLPVVVGFLLGSSAIRTMGPTTTSVAPLDTTGFVAAALAENGQPGSGPVRPTPAVARDDNPRLPDCLVSLTAVTSPPCRFGDPESRDRVVLMGDSHATQWFGTFEYVAKRQHWSLEVLAKPGCPAAKLTVVNSQLGREYRECDAWREYALKRIAQGPAPKYVVFATLNRYTGDEYLATSAWHATFTRAAATGAKVVYLRDTPFAGTDVPTCISAALQNWNACRLPRAAAFKPERFVEAGPDGRTKFGGYTIDPTPILCPHESCPAVINGVLVYRDESHITNTVAEALGPWMEHEFATRGLAALP